ncbi:hypothetical protein TSAR_011262, partial [Trichomalopsis sarcophagae]
MQDCYKESSKIDTVIQQKPINLSSTHSSSTTTPSPAMLTSTSMIIRLVLQPPQRQLYALSKILYARFFGKRSSFFSCYGGFNFDISELRRHLDHRNPPSSPNSVIPHISVQQSHNWRAQQLRLLELHRLLGNDTCRSRSSSRNQCVRQREPENEFVAGRLIKFKVKEEAIDIGSAGSPTNRKLSKPVTPGHKSKPTAAAHHHHQDPYAPDDQGCLMATAEKLEWNSHTHVQIYEDPLVEMLTNGKLLAKVTFLAVNSTSMCKSTRPIIGIDDNLPNNNAINHASATSSHYTTPSSSQHPHVP